MAIRICEAATVCPEGLTSMVCSETRRARPWTTSTPFFRIRKATPWVSLPTTSRLRG